MRYPIWFTTLVCVLNQSIRISAESLTIHIKISGLNFSSYLFHGTITQIAMPTKLEKQPLVWIGSLFLWPSWTILNLESTGHFGSRTADILGTWRGDHVISQWPSCWVGQLTGSSGTLEVQEVFLLFWPYITWWEGQGVGEVRWVELPCSQTLSQTAPWCWWNCWPAKDPRDQEREVLLQLKNIHFAMISVVVGSQHVPTIFAFFLVVWVVFVSNPFPWIRMKRFYDKMKIPIPQKKVLNNEAKMAKGFSVLIKRKLQRNQLCRSKLFRQLMALVFDPEEKEKRGE